MYLQTAFILVLLLSIIGLVIWFFNKTRTIGLVHRENISALESAIANNNDQINFRKYNLNKYDLLRYNLQDALVGQPKIEL